MRFLGNYEIILLQRIYSTYQNQLWKHAYIYRQNGTKYNKRLLILDSITLLLSLFMIRIVEIISLSGQIYFRVSFSKKGIFWGGSELLRKPPLLFFFYDESVVLHPSHHVGWMHRICSVISTMLWSRTDGEGKRNYYTRILPFPRWTGGGGTFKIFRTASSEDV